MISNQTLTLDWINRVSGESGIKDKILLEKTIRALKLLECLVASGCPHIFKGGTALMLHMDATKRLSIDIDIICPPDFQETQLEKCFEDIKEYGFNHYEFHNRNTGNDIHKCHVKFFYTPVHKTNQDEEYILLDVLFENNFYQRLEKKKITSPLVQQEGDALVVLMPCLEDMLGDKLTAFAPNTTGIPYTKNDNSMSMEIIKQLYDVSSIFDSVTDLSITNKTFQAFAVNELKYRGKDENIDCKDVLMDVIETARCISTRGKEGQGKWEELQKGITRVKGFIFSESYYLDKAIVNAAKAAYVAKSLLTENLTLQKFQDAEEIKEWIIPGSLNKLKKSNPEAFFYWYKFHELDA